ncbi:MAG: sulfatase-like hydrolase/transferase [Sedimentisphaerales bacterium]|nr:sulfatase-like hydrolase/transferase [Sedimentisphaerales bacterium]
MNRREFLQSCASILGGITIGGCALAQDRRGPTPSGRVLPNIVFILADDMGYGDIQAYYPPSKIATVHLNRLADEGMRFTDAHSGSALCSPTRYGVLTGRYCWRTRLKRGVLWPPKDEPLIEPSRLTVAGLLQQHHYHTTCIGKWHVGIRWGRDEQGEVDFNKPIEYGPTDVGFDEFFGIAGSLDMVPFAFYHNRDPVAPVTETQTALPFPRFIRQGPRGAGFEPGRVLDELAERAVATIESRAHRDNPFFVYLALTAPHKPVWPTGRFQGITTLGPYGDFVCQTDHAVGQVLEALERTGIAENTLVIFTSDNGSYMFRLAESQQDHVQDATKQGYRPENHQANANYRGTKADVWEGGHRVPFLVRWPGTVRPKSRCDETICLTDFFATCAELTGFDLPNDAAEDSFSLLALLEGRRRSFNRAPVVHHSDKGVFSLRDGKWKMVFGNGSGGREQPVGKPFQKPYFLFDLERDPAETTNVIEKYPDVAERLEKQLERIRNHPASRI